MTDNSKSTESFKEGVDFYFNEQGLMVLTEAYHLRRGHCCHSDCLHCPYKEEEKGDSEIPLEFQMQKDSNDSDPFAALVEKYMDYDPED